MARVGSDRHASSDDTLAVVVELHKMTAEADVPSQRPSRPSHQDAGAVSPSPPIPEERPEGMIPARTRRRTKLERGSMRILATGGIIGIATVLGAVLVAQDVAGWVVGLAVGLTSVILAAVLWSSRQL
jgi:hypothetical protein